MDRSNAQRLVVRRVALCALVCIAAVSAAAEESATLDVFAIRATTEGANPKSFDGKLADVKDSLASSPHDTFRTITTAQVTATFGQESKTKLNDRYTLFVTPESKDASGRVKMTVRIDEAPKRAGGKPRVALKFDVNAPPGAKIVPNGLPLDDDGALIVVLRLK